MMTDALTTRVADLESQLQQLVARRAQLRLALRQTDDTIKRLEGACGILRELLAAAADGRPGPVSGGT